MTSKDTLRQVYWTNVRDNQVGGQEDGITPEVAQDIGYSSPEDITRLTASTPVTPESHSVSPVIGSVPPEAAVTISAIRSLPRRTPVNTYQGATPRFIAGRKAKLG